MGQTTYMTTKNALRVSSFMAGFVPAQVLLYAVGKVGYGEPLLPGHGTAMVISGAIGLALYVPVLVAIDKKNMNWSVALLPVLGMCFAYAATWIFTLLQ